jgi:predicted small metal-binding protein
MESWIIECPCGVTLRGDDEAVVAHDAQRHAKAVHDMDLDDEQARSMARPG